MNRANFHWTSADGLAKKAQAVYIKEPYFTDVIGRELKLITWDVVKYNVPTKEITPDGEQIETETPFYFLQCKFLAEGRRVFNFCLNPSLIETLAKNGLVKVVKDENGVISAPDMDLLKLQEIARQHKPIKGYFWQDVNGKRKRFLTKEALDEIISLEQDKFENEMTPISDLTPEEQSKI